MRSPSSQTDTPFGASVRAQKVRQVSKTERLLASVTLVLCLAILVVAVSSVGHASFAQAATNESFYTLNTPLFYVLTAIFAVMCALTIRLARRLFRDLDAAPVRPARDEPSQQSTYRSIAQDGATDQN